ncbi:uncharacterized protein LOC135280730 isoform X1 [Passer domesticus]|uniref:uncharacterized protein LOC135280730 isoform X1 n=1 Tax=Passer domesticus TaxID=48849 RepID=UPI0030FE4944
MMEQFRDCSSSLKAPVSPLEENCITPSVSPLLSAAMRMGEELWAQAYAPRDLSAEMLVRAPELPELRPPSPRCETGGEPSAIGGHGASSVPRPGSAGCFTLCLPLDEGTVPVIWELWNIHLRDEEEQLCPAPILLVRPRSRQELSLSLARAVLAAGVVLVLQSAGSGPFHGKEWRWTSTAGAAQDGGCRRQQFSCVWMEPSLGKPLHGPAEGRPFVPGTCTG